MEENPYNENAGSATGLIAWFARNHVAANLLMLNVVVIGVVVARNIRQEIYPLYQIGS